MINTENNIYKVGETVYARIHPSQKLIVRRYVAKIYYCKVLSDPSLRELVYFERELMSDAHGHLANTAENSN